MINWKPDLAILSDLATNIFAVCLIILLILIELGRGAGLRDEVPAIPRPIEATRDLNVVERKPLRGSEMVDLLYDRRPAASGVSIDLLPDRIELTDSAGGTSTFDPARDGGAAADRLGGLQRGGDTRLYVFDNRWYAFVQARLAAGGTQWREMSVPVALRLPQGEAAGWSDGFRDLIARPLDRDRFRSGLAVLLAGSADGGRQRTSGGGLGGSFGAPPAGAPSTPYSATEILRRIGVWLGYFAIISAFAAVGIIEWRLRIRRRISSTPDLW